MSCLRNASLLKLSFLICLYTHFYASCFVHFFSHYSNKWIVKKVWYGTCCYSIPPTSCNNKKRPRSLYPLYSVTLCEHRRRHSGLTLKLGETTDKDVEKVSGQSEHPFLTSRGGIQRYTRACTGATGSPSFPATSLKATAPPRCAFLLRIHHESWQIRLQNLVKNCRKYCFLLNCSQSHRKCLVSVNCKVD